MADLPERTFTPEELAAERARVALEWQLPQPAPACKSVVCANCRRPLHRQRNGAWYHNHNASVSCYPGTGSSKRADPTRVEG